MTTACIKASGLMTSDKESVDWSMQMVISLKATGKAIN